MNGIIKIIKPLKDSGALIDGFPEIERQEDGFLGLLLAP